MEASGTIRKSPKSDQGLVERAACLTRCIRGAKRRVAGGRGAGVKLVLKGDRGSSGCTSNKASWGSSKCTGGPMVH